VEASVKAFQDAKAALDDVKDKFRNAGRGKLWLMERELEAAKRFMSQKQLALLSPRRSIRLSFRR
jgi:hypothetical protein